MPGAGQYRSIDDGKNKVDDDRAEQYGKTVGVIRRLGRDVEKIDQREVQNGQHRKNPDRPSGRTWHAIVVTVVFFRLALATSGHRLRGCGGGSHTSAGQRVGVGRLWRRGAEP